ncbi:MAG: hypothetical protein ABJE95_33915 [Byssovorax sp.]
MSHLRSITHLAPALLAAVLLLSSGASAQTTHGDDPHVTSKGLPLAERGTISLETTNTLFTNQGVATGASLLDVVVGMPVTDRVILDARLPIALLSSNFQGSTSVGNLMIGAHYVMTLDTHLWLSIGGALGIPLAPRDFTGALTSVGGAYWNLHEVYPGVVPLYGKVAIEDHLDSIVIRAEFEPVLYAPYTDVVANRQGNAQLALQHAVEVQFGGALGGGLRLQGFLFPTNDGPFGTGDIYQLAMEPFLFAEKGTLFARLGLMLPLDKELGPPARNFVGIRFAAGARFD